MIREVFEVGPLQCNCVILGCERTKQAIVIDPGDEAPRILAALRQHGLTPRYLLHTHAHFDHVGATKAVRESFDSPVCLHRDDEFMYRQLPMQGKLFGFEVGDPHPIEKFIEDEEEISFGDYAVKVLHTPGHSPGSVSFHYQGTEGEIVLSGDTLFQQSIGRTDLWGGNFDQIIHSIRNRLLTITEDALVIPGHGPTTHIGVEKRSNPFLIR